MFFKKMENIIQELDDFDESIRHLPLSEQKRLIEMEILRRQKECETTRKILHAGKIALIPALFWGGYCLFDNALIEHFTSIISLFMLSPAVMLVMELWLKKYSN